MKALKCTQCGAPGDEEGVCLSQCAKCRKVQYCSKSCQVHPVALPAAAYDFLCAKAPLEGVSQERVRPDGERDAPRSGTSKLDGSQPKRALVRAL